MRRVLAFLLVPPLALAGGLLLTALRPDTSRAADDDETTLDYAYFKSTVAPMLRRLCGECHANPRKRKKMGKFFLRPAPGRRVRERFEERNFKTVRAFIEEQDPAASIVLLKAIGAARGGVTHEGGAILRDNMPEYGQLVDFINGKKAPAATFKPPLSEEGRPDFLFFYKRIEPVLLAVCAECHEGRGKGRFRLIVHARDVAFPVEDHYTNFETVVRLLKPGSPKKSRFLQKPLAIADGGIKHRGGDRIHEGGANHENWIRFINGERGPPLPTGGEQKIPTLTAEGLTIQVEDFHFEGDVFDDEREGAQEFYVARPGSEGGTVWTDIRVADAGPYLLEFRVAPGQTPMQWHFVGGSARALGPQENEEVNEHGFVYRGPANLLDDEAPLLDARGGLKLREGILQMDGRQEDAVWLSPSEVRNSGVSARVALADDEEGGDDVLLLFDMNDGWNGKFVGLTDGGRQFVMGVLESGRVRVLRARKAPRPSPEDRGKPRELKVEYFGGVAVGSLDGRPLAFLNLSELIGRRPFGVMTHGLVGVHAVAALEEYEVYNVKFRTGPVVELPRGLLRLRVELPPGSGALDSVRFRVPGG